MTSGPRCSGHAAPVTQIVAAWQAGAISRETMSELFRRGEVLPEGRTNEEEAKLIAAGKDSIDGDLGTSDYISQITAAHPDKADFKACGLVQTPYKPIGFTPTNAWDAPPI